jgi:hypothetical protein
MTQMVLESPKTDFIEKHEITTENRLMYNTLSNKWEWITKKE